jgi:hypothetical protein
MYSGIDVTAFTMNLIDTIPASAELLVFLLISPGQRNLDRNWNNPNGEQVFFLNTVLMRESVAPAITINMPALLSLCTGSLTDALQPMSSLPTLQTRCKLGAGLRW